MINRDIYVASTRFGLGLRPDEAARFSGGTEDWLRQQVMAPVMTGEAFSGLKSSTQNMQDILALRKDAKNAGADAKIAAQQEKQEEFKSIMLAELRAKLQLAITTPTSFYERLVDFWGNHFAVSVKKGPVRALAGPYEREAIRPHVTGRFVDLLLAVERHPAMLIYLDNAQSIGPDSPAGMRQDKGLNENLAREIMELHTLGVNGGYTQTDVTTFAKVITGWSIGPLESDTPGQFRFIDRRHEPGSERILGKNYPDTGEEQGIRVLRDLAAHPATAHHIATKLVRHFVADDPPEAVVTKVAKVFLDSGGDLLSVYGTLISLPEAWDVQANPKVKDGYDLVVSAARSADRSADKYIDYCLAALHFLGDVPYTADSPAGFPDTTQDIAGPDAMIRRVEWAQSAANKLEPSQPPMDLASLAIGPIMSDATKSAIKDARNDREAFALLFGSPEFQRR